MPLSFDLPLEELYEYQGRNPQPADFDDYWAKALAEMQAVDPQVELIPADFKSDVADCFHMYFTGVRGARVHAKLLHPKTSSNPQPAVLMFHGYSSDSGDWLDKLGYVAQGYTIAALDCRGQGGRSEDTGGIKGTTLNGHIIRGLEGPAQDMVFRHIFLDTAQLAKIVMAMPQVDEQRVGTTGASQGGALTIACAALEPKIKLAVPVYPFLSDYQRVWEMDVAVNAYGELASYFRRHDPMHQREIAIFEQLGYIDIQHLASRIQAEIYLSMGLMDEICPPSTQFATYNKITAKKSLALYPDFAHEDLKGHRDRIFQFLLGL